MSQHNITTIRNFLRLTLDNVGVQNPKMDNVGCDRRARSASHNLWFTFWYGECSDHVNSPATLHSGLKSQLCTQVTYADIKAHPSTSTPVRSAFGTSTSSSVTRMDGPSRPPRPQGDATDSWNPMLVGHANIAPVARAGTPTTLQN